MEVMMDIRSRNFFLLGEKMILIYRMNGGIIILNMYNGFNDSSKLIFVINGLSRAIESTLHTHAFDAESFNSSSVYWDGAVVEIDHMGDEARHRARIKGAARERRISMRGRCRHASYCHGA